MAPGAYGVGGRGASRPEPDAFARTDANAESGSAFLFWSNRPVQPDTSERVCPSSGLARRGPFDGLGHGLRREQLRQYGRGVALSVIEKIERHADPALGLQGLADRRVTVGPVADQIDGVRLVEGPGDR